LTLTEGLMDSSGSWKVKPGGLLSPAGSLADTEQTPNWAAELVQEQPTKWALQAAEMETIKNLFRLKLEPNIFGNI
jgi:hypothetical protein